MIDLTRVAGYVKTVAATRSRRACLPRMLTYIVSFTCNARCVMCDSWRKPREDELNVDEIARIFAQLPQLDVVRLSGGEPFARIDFPEIARLATTLLRPTILHVTSNGFLSDRIVDFCERRERAVPLYLLVSLDGTEAKHDEIRGREGAYRRAMETLRRLAPRRKELRLTLAVNQTIVDPAGIDEAVALGRVLDELDVRNHVVLAYRESATYTENTTNVAPQWPGAFEPYGEFSPADLDRLFAMLDDHVGNHGPAERATKRYYVDGLRNRLVKGVAKPNPMCAAVHAHLRIFPNGDVPICQFNGQRIGNLRTSTFEEIWNGGAADEARAWVRACPGCWAECEVLPSAVYSGDLVTQTAFGHR